MYTFNAIASVPLKQGKKYGMSKSNNVTIESTLYQNKQIEK